MERRNVLTIVAIAVVVVAIFLVVSTDFTGNFIRGSDDKAIKLYKDKVKGFWLGGEEYSLVLTEVDEDGAVFVLTDPAGLEMQSTTLKPGMKEVIGVVEISVLSTQQGSLIIRRNWANIRASLI